MLYPLIFQPIFKERVWGGRNLERLYGKSLPAGKVIGESWEITDRPGDASVIANGPLAGKTLRWLMENQAANLLGHTRAANAPFPLLIKLLDAQEKLSLQVHPPAAIAAALGGEPKTEMWYIAAAAAGAELYVGLKRGMTKGEFERKIQDGSVAGCFHRVPVQAGDAMFLPSGRVHAIGAGLVIFEIQQNSDTTYRVFDWNRVGLDGQMRELHVTESLLSIDFSDFEPPLVEAAFDRDEVVKRRLLARDPLFTVEEWRLVADSVAKLTPGVLQIIACLTGNVCLNAGETTVELAPGQFSLVPACLAAVSLRAATIASVLCVATG